MKYSVTVLGTSYEGTFYRDLYYTTKKKLNTEEEIEKMRKDFKENIPDINPGSGLVILNIFGPLKK